MNKVLCIYPAESNTEFLRPVYDYLCNDDNVFCIDKSVTDEDYFDTIAEQLVNVELVIFMGHGSSNTLYGDHDNILFDAQNKDLLKNNKLILFACRTSDFCRTYELTNAVGFGFIPSSEDDIKNSKFHDLSIEELNYFDVEKLRRSLCNILLNTLKESNLLELDDFVRCFTFNANLEIVKILTVRKKETKNYRLLADILYYVCHEMVLRR